MKSKLLHICAMVLASQDVICTDEQQILPREEVESSSNEQMAPITSSAPTDSYDPTGSNDGVMTPTDPYDPILDLSDSLLSSIGNDITALNSELSSLSIDASTLASLQSTQATLSAQIALLSTSETLQEDLSALNKAMTEAQMLLIKLKSENFITKNHLEPNLKKISDVETLLDLDITKTQISQTTNDERISLILDNKDVVEEHISEVTSSLESLHTDEITNTVQSLQSTKTDLTKIAKIRALINSLSANISQAQQTLGKKAENLTVITLQNELKQKANTQAVHELSRKLETAIPLKIDKEFDFSKTQERIEKHLKSVEDKTNLIEPTKIAEEINENAKDIATHIKSIHQTATDMMPAVTESNNKIASSQNHISEMEANAGKLSQLEITNKEIEHSLDKYADVTSIDNLKARIQLLRANQKNNEDAFADFLKTFEQLAKQMDELNNSKISAKEVSVLAKQYQLILIDLKKLRIDISDNTNSLNAEVKLYDALQKSFKDLLDEVSALRRMYNTHVITDQDAKWLEELTFQNKQLEISIATYKRDIEQSKTLIESLRQQISETETEIPIRESQVEEESAKNMPLRDEYEEKCAQLKPLEEQVDELEKETQNLQDDLRRKEKALGVEIAETEKIAVKLRIIGRTLNADLVANDFSSFAENLRITNRIKEVSDIDCLATNEIGATVYSDSRLLSYTKTANGGILNFTKSGSIEIATSGNGTLTFTDGISGIALSRTLSDDTTIVLNAANLVGSSLAYTVAGDLSVVNAALVCEVDAPTIDIAEPDITRTSRMAASGTLTYTSAATVDDPAIADLVTDKTLTQFVLNDRDNRLSAIGNAFYTDVLEPTYDAFSYSVNVANKVNGVERCEITNCTKIAPETPTTSADEGHVLTYTKHVSTVESDNASEDGETAGNGNEQGDSASTGDGNAEASGGNNTSSAVESGGTIAFTTPGHLSITTTGTGKLTFTSGVTGKKEYTLSKDTTTKILAENLSGNSVEFSLTPDEKMSVTRIFIDTVQTFDTTVSVPLTNPTVETKTVNGVYTHSGKVSEIVEDPSLTALVAHKNEHVASLQLRNSTQMAANEEVKTKNASLEADNDRLTKENVDLEEQKNILPTKITALQERLIELRQERARAAATLNIVNLKLQAVSDSDGLSMNLTDPTLTDRKLITDYRNFKIHLKLSNIIPHVSKIKDCTPIEPGDETLAYRKKWMEIYSHKTKTVDNYPANSTLTITTAGTGTFEFIDGVTGINPVNCETNGTTIVPTSNNLATNTIEYTLQQGLTYSKSVLEFPTTTSTTTIYNEKTDKPATDDTTRTITLTKKWTAFLTNSTAKTATTTLREVRETGGIINFPWKGAIDLKLNGTDGSRKVKFTEGVTSQLSYSTANLSIAVGNINSNSSVAYEYENSSGLRTVLNDDNTKNNTTTNGLNGDILTYHMYDKEISEVPAMAESKLVLTKNWVEKYSENSWKTDSKLTIATKGSGTLKVTSGLSAPDTQELSSSFSSVSYDLKYSQKKLSSTTLNYSLSQGLEYDSSELTFSVNNAIDYGDTSTKYNGKFTKKWDATLTHKKGRTSSTSTTTETGGTLTYPWGCKVKFSGTGTLKVESNSADFDTLIDTSNSSLSYTASNITGIQYYYYYQELSKLSSFSPSDPTYIKYKDQKSGTLSYKNNYSDQYIEEGLNHGKATGTYYKCYDVIGNKRYYELATKAYPINAYGQSRNSTGSHYAEININDQSHPKNYNTYAWSTTVVTADTKIESKTFWIDFIGNKGNSIRNLKIYGTINNMPTSAIITAPPVSAKVTYTFAPWGLYISGYGTLTQASPSYSNSVNTETTHCVENCSSNLSFTLDDVEITSAKYATETYETGGKLIFPSSTGSLTITTIGSGTTSIKSGATSASSTGNTLTSTINSSTVEFNLTRGRYFVEAVLTYEENDVQVGNVTLSNTSDILKLFKNYKVTCKVSNPKASADPTSSQLSGTGSNTIVETGGKVTYPRAGYLQFAGSGTLTVGSARQSWNSAFYVSGTSCSYTISGGSVPSVSSVLYYSYDDINVSSVTPPALGSLNAYECGGTLTFPADYSYPANTEPTSLTKNNLKINLNGSGTLAFTQGVTGTASYTNKSSIELAGNRLSGSSLTYTLTQGLTYSGAVLNLNTAKTVTIDNTPDKLTHTKTWLLTSSGSNGQFKTTPQEIGGTLTYPQSGELTFTGNGTLKINSANKTLGSAISVSNTSTSYTATISSGGSAIDKVRYHSARDFKIGDVKPDPGELDSYESGGILDYSAKVLEYPQSQKTGTFKIMLDGTGGTKKLTIVSGVKENASLSNKGLVQTSSFSINVPYLTGAPINYNLDKGLTYQKAVLDCTIGTTVQSNELDYTKTWRRILTNDGTWHEVEGKNGTELVKATNTTTENGGILSLLDKGTVVLTMLGNGPLTFTEGVNVNLDKNISGSDNSITILPDNLSLLDENNRYHVSYVFPDNVGMHSKSLDYRYRKASEPFRLPLGSPDSNTCQRQKMTSTTLKTVADPEVMAMIAATDELEKSLAMSGVELEAKRNTLKANNGTLTSENTSLKATNGDLISANNQLKIDLLNLRDRKNNLGADIETLKESEQNQEIKLVSVGGNNGISYDVTTTQFDNFIYNLNLTNKLSSTGSETGDEFAILPFPDNIGNYSIKSEQSKDPKKLSCTLTKILDIDTGVQALAERKAAALAQIGTDEQEKIAERSKLIEENAHLQTEIDNKKENNTWLETQIEELSGTEQKQGKNDALRDENDKKKQEIEKLIKYNETLTEKRDQAIEDKQNLKETIDKLEDERAVLLPENSEYIRNLETKINAIGKLFGRNITLIDLITPSIKTFVYNLTVTHTKSYTIACQDVAFEGLKGCETFYYTKNSRHEIMPLDVSINNATRKVKEIAKIHDTKNPIEEECYLYYKDGAEENEENGTKAGRYFNLYTSTFASPYQALFTIGDALSNGNISVSFKCEGKKTTTVINSVPITYTPEFKLNDNDWHKEGGEQTISLKDLSNKRFGLQYTDALTNKELKLEGTIDNIPESVTISVPQPQTTVYFNLEHIGLYQDNKGTAIIENAIVEEDEQHYDATFSTEDQNSISYIDGSGFTYSNKFTPDSSQLIMKLDNAIVTKAWYLNEYEIGGTLQFPEIDGVKIKNATITLELQGYGVVKFYKTNDDGSKDYLDEKNLDESTTITFNPTPCMSKVSYEFEPDSKESKIIAKNVSIKYDVITQHVPFTEDPTTKQSNTTRTIKDQTTAECISYAEAD